jgi:hypothetical protein
MAPSPSYWVTVNQRGFLRLFSTVEIGVQEPVYQSATFDVKDLPNRDYFYRLQKEKSTQTKKTVLLK